MPGAQGASTLGASSGNSRGACKHEKLVNFKPCLTFHQPSKEDEVLNISVTGDQVIDHGTIQCDALLYTKSKTTLKLEPKRWQAGRQASKQTNHDTTGHLGLNKIYDTCSLKLFLMRHGA